MSNTNCIQKLHPKNSPTIIRCIVYLSQQVTMRDSFLKESKNVPVFVAPHPQ